MNRIAEVPGGTILAAPEAFTVSRPGYMSMNSIGKASGIGADTYED